MQKILNYINGALVEPESGEYIDNYEPATGKVYSLCPDSDFRDVDNAIEAAEKAFPIWSATSADNRSKILMRIADLIDENLDRFAQAESIDTGKTVHLAKTMDIPRASANFRFYASAILHYASNTHSMEKTAINYTLKQPIGIVGCISPWNLPLYLFTWKIAPALAIGNCVIAKPSEITPMTAFLLSEICIQAGLPAGVLNIVQGFGQKVGESIVKHPKIKAISFTGGTKTGETIAKITAPMFKKVSLELGGINPCIIFADCEYEKTLDTVVKASFTNQGQICLCASRIFVESAIYEKFKNDFVKKVENLKVGDPNDAATNQGAIVSTAQLEKVLFYIGLAKQEGGKILTGGNQVHLNGRCAEGYFVQPTVVEGLEYDARTNQEEIFGPVASIMPFENKEEVIKYANSVRYGLSATVFTKNIDTANQVAQELESGIIWVNCWLVRDLRTPFGGLKDSGLGTEGGFDALNFFTDTKNVCIKIDS